MGKHSKMRRIGMLIRQIWGWWLVLLICGGAIITGLAALDPPPWRWETAEITVVSVADYRTPGARTGILANSPKRYTNAEMVTAADGTRYWLEQSQASLAMGEAYRVAYFERNGLRVIREAARTDTASEFDPQSWMNIWRMDMVFRVILLLALAVVIALMVLEFRKAWDNVKILEYQESAARSRKDK